MAARYSEIKFAALEEGIERLRAMARRISEAHDLVAENTHLLLRDREMARGGPLLEARDLRTHSSQLAFENHPPSPRAIRTRRRR